MGSESRRATPTQARRTSRQILAMRWMQGRASELLGDTEEIEHATTIVHAYADYVWPIIAVLAAAADQRDRARAALDRILVSGLRSLPESSAWLPALFCVAEVADYLEDREAAHQVAELLEPYVELPMIASLGVMCFGATARSLGLARRTIGDLDGAVAALESAVLQNRRIGHLPISPIRARRASRRRWCDEARQGDRAGPRTSSTTSPSRRRGRWTSRRTQAHGGPRPTP